MPSPPTTDDRAQSPPRRPRACLPCTKAKSRCQYERNESDGGCHRCRRLNIHCAPQTTKSLRKPRQLKTQGSVSNADVVDKAKGSENRDESIPAGIQPAWTAPVDSTPPESLLGSTGDSSTEITSTSTSTSELYKHHDLPQHSKSLPSASTSSRIPPSPGSGVSWDEADRAVEKFTTIFSAHFPFIILEHDVTAHRLFVEKPLLFRAILMTTVHLTLAKRREIRRSVDAWIGQHLLVMNEPSLGALQGLIVYMAWANPHFYSDHRQTQLIYLTLGLAHNLGITKKSTIEDTSAKTEAQINEEHRAFLACYYILAFNSFQFGRPNPLSSSYAEYCLESLERSSEFQTDFLLIKLIKFRLYIGRIPSLYQGICDMKWCREVSIDAAEQFSELRKELELFMDDVTHHTPKFLLLWTLTRNVLMQLYLPMTYITADTEMTSQFQLECMKYCLEAAKPYIEMVKAVSPDGLLYCPFTTITDLFTIVISISRLLLVDIPGWDLRAARRSIDMKTILDEFLAKCIMAKKAQAEMFAAAAVAYPSSYVPDGPREAMHNRVLILTKALQSMKDWLRDQGLFEDDEEELGIDALDEPTTSARACVGPQNPQWTFGYFFEEILNMKEPTSS